MTPTTLGTLAFLLAYTLVSLAYGIDFAGFVCGVLWVAGSVVWVVHTLTGATE